MRSIPRGQRVLLLAVAIVIGGVTLAGCAADPSGPPSPSQKETRSNSDRFFDKMKQEERERGVGSSPTR